MGGTASQQPRSNARNLAAAMVGTTVEYYDFYLYGYAAALVFGPLFFPADSSAAQTLLAFISFGIAFIARPIGAVAFGHFGDRLGRKAMLIVSLLITGGCTVAIAFLPTFALAGWLAPALLCLMRFGQGFGLSGEWTGAALLSVENAPRGWDARFGIMPSLGATFGNLAAIGVFLALGWLLDDASFTAWGWRIPFLASLLLILVALWVRARIPDTAEFVAAVREEAPPRTPILLLLRTHGRIVLIGAAGIVCPFALVYLSGPFALAQAVGPLGYDRERFQLLQLVGIVSGLPPIVVLAMLADRVSPSTIQRWGAAAAILFGLGFGPALASRSWPVLTAMFVASGLCWAMTNAAMSAWLSRLFPVRVRYSGFALAFNAAGIVGGALIPILAQAMSNAGGLTHVGLLLSGAGAISFLGVSLAR